MNMIDLPASREVDARNRAWRTFLQGRLIDAVIAVVLVLGPAMSSVEWSVSWWVALGLALAKSLLTAVVSYVARKVTPPEWATTGEDIEEDDTPAGEGGYV